MQADSGKTALATATGGAGGFCLANRASRRARLAAGCMLFFLWLIASCRPPEIRTPAPAARKTQWNGSPYVEWEVSTFLNPLLIYRAHSDGILALEGIFRDGAFEAEKSVLLDVSGERVLWRTSTALELKYSRQPFSATIFRVQDAPQNTPLLLLWTRRDVLRVIRFLSGEDAWNRPNCRLPVPAGINRVAAVCFGRLSLLDASTGRVLASMMLDFNPVDLQTFGGDYLALDEHRDLHLVSLAGARTAAVPTPENLERFITVEQNLVMVSRLRDTYVLQVVRLENGRWKLGWKTRLEQFPEVFWVHAFRDRLIFPVGFNCIRAAGTAHGEELWVSCGLDESNPPAYDEDGLFLLSSRSERGHRPVIYVDGFNGLQTPVFRNSPGQEVVPFLAMTLAPGPVVNGVLYGVHSTSKLFALRVAAPVEEEQPPPQKPASNASATTRKKGK